MKYVIEDTTMTGIADAIRDKASSTENMTPAEMMTAIVNLSTGGGSISDDTFAEGIIIPAVDITRVLYNQWNDNRLHIEHGLNKVPNICNIWSEISSEEQYIPLTSSFILAYYLPLTYKRCYLSRTYNETGGTANESSNIGDTYQLIEFTETEVLLGSQAGVNFYAGRQYFWAAARIGAFVE